MTTPTPAALYYVPSSQNQGRAGAPHYYQITEFATGRVRYYCDCMAGQNGRRCWHVEAVIAGMVAPARPKRPAAPATDPRITAAALLYA